MRNAKRRVFLGTVEIAGFYTNLTEGLRRAGVDCTFVELSPHPFKYKHADVPLPAVVRVIRSLAAARGRLGEAATQRRSIVRLLYWLEVLPRLMVLLWAIVRFDVFCFGFRTNIVGERVGFWDIRLLRALGKRVICVFHGADSRPPYLTGPYVRTLRAQSESWPELLSKLTRKHKRIIKTLERMADVTVSNPVYGHFHESSFVDIMQIGIPTCAGGQVVPNEVGVGKGENLVRILHAPSNRDAKGSDVIARCIKRLQEQGYKIDYRELSGLPNDEVKRQLLDCDFVVDQLYSDGPMAGFAAEAAAYGKAAVVGGYLEDPTWTERVPTLYCHPKNLEAAIRKLLDDPSYRKDLGRRAQEFVTTSWSSLAVAKRFLRVIDDDVPDSWVFDPKNVSHLQGGGMDESLLRDALTGLVTKFGRGVLELEDKPRLRDLLLGLIRTNTEPPALAQVDPGWDRQGPVAPSIPKESSHETQH